MAEAIVSRVLEKLSSVLEEEVRRITNVRGEVEKLASNFRAIKAVLEDAERQQMGKGKASVRDWLYKLKEVSYDIENVLDEWSTAIFKSKLEKKKVCSFIPSPSFCFNRGKLLHKTARKILELNGRLDVIANEREKYGLKELSVEKPIRREQTTSLVNLAEVCGRVMDKERIVDILLSEGRIDVISIVGVGGIGKTTLAQVAFNNEKVESHFEERIWVCVSDPFDVMRIAKAILTSLGENAWQNLVELEDVLKLLRDSVKDKKFLLVLDDVWAEQPEGWDDLKNSLSSGSPGSKILVTTRKETVARAMGCPTWFPVERLSEEESWKLFSQIAYLGRSNEDCEKLREIGWKIAEKCKGLPLTLKTVGGLMLLKKTIEEWQSVLDSEIWELEVAEEGLFRPLMFSYFDLPSHLRECFSYCAVFPKDHVIEKDNLIGLWMAQGLLKGTQHRDMEMVGEDYFNDLSMRSFFQDFEKDENGGIIRCKMHDMVHDFAQFLTRGECLTVEAGSSSSIEGFNESARHVMFMIPYGGSDEWPTRIYDAENLHTLLVDCSAFGELNVDLLKLFEKLKCLRILKCHSERINKCPKQIRNLIHLRSLDLSDNMSLEKLPEAVCDLYNLLILDISRCWNLRSLPCRMGNLINLRHLRNESTAFVEFMPKGMEKLTCLRTLSSFVVDSGGKGAALSELGNLIHLRGYLVIIGLRNVRDEREAEKAQLRNKKGLTTLFLSFGLTHLDKSEVSEASVLVLEALEPPLDLERLEIWAYKCPTPTLGVWPSWIVSLTKLKFFGLVNCFDVEQLPPLWKLPSLESLALSKIGGVKKVGVEFFGIETSSLSPSSSSSSSVVAFPNLKSLKFFKMEEWEEWDYGSRGEEDIKIMPCLSSLGIFGCEKLKMLPDSILRSTTLQNLEIWGSPVISSRCKEEYQPHISRIPKVGI
ncbi:hypothetical protein SLA2020_519810 [Shorea laevis]